MPRQFKTSTRCGSEVGLELFRMRGARASLFDVHEDFSGEPRERLLESDRTLLAGQNDLPVQVLERVFADVLAGSVADTGGFAKKDRITLRFEITKLSDIDAEVKKWLKTAYDRDA